MELSNLFYLGAFLKNAGLVVFFGASILVVYLAFKDTLKRGIYCFLPPYHLYYAMERLRHPWKKEINQFLFGGFFAVILGIIFTDVLANFPQLLNALLKGVSTGSFYALMAFAIILIFRTTDLVNFAQADMAAITIFVLITLLGGFNENLKYPEQISMPYVIAILITLIFAALFGAFTEIVFIKPIQRQHPISQIILTLGLAMMFMSLGGIIWDMDEHKLPNMLGKESFHTAIYDDVKAINNELASNIKSILETTPSDQIAAKIEEAVKEIKEKKIGEKADEIIKELDAIPSTVKREDLNPLIDKIASYFPSYKEEQVELSKVLFNFKYVKRDLEQVKEKLNDSIEEALSLKNIGPKLADEKTKAEIIQKAEKEIKSYFALAVPIIKISDEVVVTKDSILSIFVTFVLMAIIFALFKYTLIGIALRATAQSQNTSKLMGINVNQVFIFSWAVSVTMGGIAALFFSAGNPVSMVSVSGLLLKGFSAAVLGGFSSLPGAVLGGFLLGIFDNILGYTHVKEVLSFGIILAVLIIKPEGILGHSGTKKV